MTDNLVAKILLGLSDTDLDKVGTTNDSDLFDNNYRIIKSAQKRTTGKDLTNVDASRAEIAMEELRNRGQYPESEFSQMIANVKTRRNFGEVMRGLREKVVASQVAMKKLDNTIEDQHDNVVQLENSLLGYSAAMYNQYLYSILVGLILLVIVIVPGLEQLVSTYILNRQPVILSIMDTEYAHVSAILGVQVIYRLLKSFLGDKPIGSLVSDTAHNIWAFFARGFGSFTVSVA